MFEPNERLLLNYPASTLLETNRFWFYRSRYLQILSVRDLLINPLTPEEFLSRPLIHRGQFLIRARDLDTHRVQQFYLSSSKEFFRPTGLRLALYWPGQPGRLPADIFSRRYATTRRDRILLARTLLEFQRMGCKWSGFDLRITVDCKTA